MLTQNTLAFLRDLSKNNNRDWFNAHKDRYIQTVKEPFEAFIQTLVAEMQAFEPTLDLKPKEAIFRIYRDTRFSKDKSPYKNNIGALISTKGRKHKEHPGYYFHLEGGRLMLGGGAYFLPTDKLLQVRRFIAQHSAEFRKVISAKAFRDKFGEVKGEQHKRLPKEFAAIQEEIPEIANKQFYFMTELPPEEALEQKGVKTVASYYKAGKAFNEFFARAMQ